jgi:hypothetical protein
MTQTQKVSELYDVHDMDSVCGSRARDEQPEPRAAARWQPALAHAIVNFGDQLVAGCQDQRAFFLSQP